jgi:ferritin
MSVELNNAINDQIALEFNSSYLYLAMSVWMGTKNFRNLENLYFKKYQEEFEHAMKFINHIKDLEGTIVLPAIEKPKFEWEGIKEIVTKAYEHEQYVTKQIHKLVAIADEKNDYASKLLIDWFVEEQIEEEVSARHLVKMSEGFKNDWLFDHRARREIPE